ncbi:S-adenosyl-L-methionine-dependent methyltransferase [Penicillium cinerascens]|uniref:S-adenosyl-L-methionine-dependent methyltransferase n=1 Tax=Penicillium cinerascens TaxID=70096 RepID=A0A9W9N2D6_9EURO|nr:S-adenosyl-L-methionine-dependent methyltransferase [Penicillium cinerascens]KAJ5211942.1 S-adenosyl-L-methionine-dependent methyltransferase [Penicillium cinerascens]
MSYVFEVVGMLSVALTITRTSIKASLTTTCLRAAKWTRFLMSAVGRAMPVRDLAPYFINAIGLDPSEGMISNALSLGDVSSNFQPIRFEISTAADLGSESLPPILDSSIDLIIAATAALWFDMTRF